MQSSRSAILFLAILIGATALVNGVGAQAKKKKTTASKPAAATVQTKEEAKPQTPAPVAKRNERPGTNGSSPVASTNGPTAAKPDPFFVYEFTQPEFITSRILIEHDDQGKGKFSFARRGSDELISDPLQISAAAMERLKAAYSALNFFDSTESYQHEKDFSHLGVVKITMTKGGRDRTTTFSYTVNKGAKALADEYRKVSNQALWIFDITLARENQPLDAPNQMSSLESMLKRNEISDPEQLLSLLRELSDDERIPLIARNHATRIVKQIEKTKK